MPSDYASGSSLFSGSVELARRRQLSPVRRGRAGRVTVVFPAGYEVRVQDYQLRARRRPPRDALRAAMLEMSRFYR
jgi:hypothetical protein